MSTDDLPEMIGEDEYRELPPEIAQKYTAMDEDGNPVPTPERCFRLKRWPDDFKGITVRVR